MIDLAASLPTHTHDESLRAADGTPLRRKLARASRRARVRAFLLVVPLLAFVLVTFFAPIAQMLFLSVHEGTVARLMPRTVMALRDWQPGTLPDEAAFAALTQDLVENAENRTIGQVATQMNFVYPGTRSLFTSTARNADDVEPPYKQTLIDADDEWADPRLWMFIKRLGDPYTVDYYLQATDRTFDAEGRVVPVEEERRIYVQIFVRTLLLSGLITLICLALGYPVAYLLASLPLRTSNLLMILVLLPFWTSLLVRTTAWIALLQRQGVINEVLVALGLVNDEGRLQMIYNATGSVIAMTHILLPFMILPLYSVMKTIPPSYMRAARSLGARSFYSFRRVYLPQTVPGIAAGVLLVFILAVGYYITPALVGGQDGQLISNFIALHMQKTLNWNLAAALGGILLIAVLLLYWLFNKIVGIDRLKLG